MSNHICSHCGETFATLSRLRLHEDECGEIPVVPETGQVKALEKVGTGRQFQSALDRRKYRLRQHNLDTLEEVVRNLRETIRAFGSERLVRELWYHELIRSGSFAVLNEDTGITPKMTEYLYGLAVTIPPTDSTPSVGFYDVVDALSLVYDYFRVEQYKILAAADSPSETRRAYAQQLLLERELTTGRFGHGQQRREFVRRVYSPINKELTDILGFSVTEAVAAGDAINRLYETRLGGGRLLPLINHVVDVGDGPFQVRFSDVYADVQETPEQACPKVLVNVAKYDKHRFNPLGSEFEVGEYTAHEEPFGTLYKTIPERSFTPSDVESTLNEDLPELELVVDELSVILGSYESDLSDQTGSFSKFDYPFDHNPIHQYPLLKGPDEQYHLGPQNALWYSLSTRLRYDLLGSKHSGEGSRKIGTGVESWVVGCVQNLVDDDVTLLSGINYDYADGESDVVLLYDDTFVVIECKTRGLRLESRLGPFGSYTAIADNVKEILEEPYRKQAMKLINAIKEDRISELRADQGTVQVSAADFSEYIPAVIVAEPLDFVGTVLYADIIEFEEVPYFGDVFGWQTICRHLSGSRDLLSYLRRRIAVGVTGQVFSIDEIDYLGSYLDHGLEYPERPIGNIIDIHHVGSDLEKVYKSEPGVDMTRL
jgi:hypothetical protein